MTSHYVHLLAGLLVFSAGLVSPLPGATELRVADFGTKGDGVTDDGPAIQRALDKLREAGSFSSLRFESHKTYRVKTTPETWVFTLKDLQEVTLDGGGSLFLLDARLRFLHLTHCTNVTVRGCSVDFDPLPFADGTIVAKNPQMKTVDVKIHDGFVLPPLGGPTREREQAYFGMLWHQGPHSLTGQHYFIKDSQAAYPGSLEQRIFRVFAVDNFNGFNQIKEGQTRISLPVRGIAHKMEGYGASPAFVIEENHSVLCEDINLWSAPLFGVNLARNHGTCVFRRFDIRPKPGTGRLTSSWRDGFHVKANYATLLWEDCHLEGMNDDSFNTATHSAKVVEVLAPGKFRLRQNFPLGIVPYHVGDIVSGYDVAGGKLLDRARITASLAQDHPSTSGARPASPVVTVTLDHPLPDLKVGAVVWNVSSANPDTTLRRCKIFNSCRFQSPVKIEDCDITAFCWFYGDNIEGPLPADVVIRNSRFQRGRGNPRTVLEFTSLIQGPSGKRAVPTQPVIARVLLQNNTLDGLLDLGYTEKVTLTGNRFLPPHGKLTIHDSRLVQLQNNFLGNQLLERLDQIQVPDEPTRRGIEIRN